jgi:hypothetical protein
MISNYRITTNQYAQTDKIAVLLQEDQCHPVNNENRSPQAATVRRQVWTMSIQFHGTARDISRARRPTSTYTNLPCLLACFPILFVKTTHKTPKL